MADTKEKILDAAERLFARDGFAATPLRAITAEAGVNLAAVNYHFQSKEALIQCVFARRVGPVNVQRLKYLDRLEEDAGGKAPRLDGIVTAFVEPVLALRRQPQGEAVMKLLGRAFVEPGGMQAMGTQMAEVKERFLGALAGALPNLPAEELIWRVHFMIGVVAHTMAGGRVLQILSSGKYDTGDVESTTRRLVNFVSAGLRAPLSKGGRQR